ncbi:hypothetical protein ILP92_17760 [Maribius pontilimi]|uniref:Uncharacterized protein n=1 Tax=Palleronia pontilimi TaxID=1964209 RepID=A0A934IL61_9RHOB|nr:DUF6428 family protein [Palleronia pontilimi]MBJ3764585.1 hypothetical protein [Palleronia pontilimi]
MNTLFDLLKELERQEPSHPLVFETAEGEISPGYQVTELRHSFSKGIDCGGNVETWSEARLQILDGQGQTHMSVGKFSSIVAKCLAVMPELASASLMIEFGHNNTELRLMSPRHLELRGKRVIIVLGNLRAVCKPAKRVGLEIGGDDECSGRPKTSARKSTCCPVERLRENISPCCA